MAAHPSTVSPIELVGATIAERFEVLAFIRAGGMGRVYRARDKVSGALVALKLLAPGAQPGASATGRNREAERFEREAGVLATLDHPGVVRYVDHGRTPEGEQYLAMEWLEGEDLADRLGADGTLGIEDTITLAQRAAAALGAAHRAGIVHRDLKPANIFLVDGHVDLVKLLDFGIARAAASSDLTQTGIVIGTPAYMAPEQVRGDAVGPFSDVYALGAVIFRCLTGRSPFSGAHQLALLAKVMIEPAAPIRELRPDVPESLDELVSRLLVKDPAGRPADGSALHDELIALQREGATSANRIRAAISAREQRVVCIVLCASGPTTEEMTVAESSAAHTEDAIRCAVEARGGMLDKIARGACVITIPNAASAAEQATRAAQCALALATLRPGTPLFVATGRVVVTGEGRVGEVIDRAAEALVAARQRATGGVQVDEATAKLLEGSFRMSGEGEWRVLDSEEDAVAPVRTLLGKPTPCVGREAQLAMLDAVLGTCADESRAGAALVVAPPGLGKTHLVHERLRPSREKHAGIDVVYAKGDPIRAASAFGIAAQILARCAGMRDSDGPTERSAKLEALVVRDFGKDDAAGRRELLGEICGFVTPIAYASAALRAARADAAVMADALRDVWVAWISARVARGAVLVLLEDAHWADAASVRLLEAALAELGERPLFVLATSRPDGSQLFAERFRPHGLVEITLGPLSAGSMDRLVCGALGSAVDPELVRTLAKRSGGHPFHLEELVRAVADGRGATALPDSVLGMVQARLDDLSAESRRMLRAASVFGETFRPAGVAALMGDEMSERAVRARLLELVEKEMVTEDRASSSSESTYRFRHMLLRDTAYATLAELDCSRAHRRAAAWLEEIGEADPAVLGEHYDRGHVPERAADFFRRAAAQAVARGDFERAQAHAERALALGPEASTEAALLAIQAEILYWRGDITAAAERAPSAGLRLSRGAPEWFDAVSVAVGALGQLGRNDEVAALLRDAAHVTSQPASRGAHVVALCRGMTQLFWAHAGAGLGDVRSSLDALVDRPEPLDAYQSGWVHRVRAEAAWLHERDMGKCLAELEASCEAFARARALRPLCLSRLNAASLTGWSGDARRGLELVALARSDAERLGSGFLLSYGRAVEGLLLAYASDASAVQVMTRSLAELGGSPRLTFICRFVLSTTALDRGDIDVADEHARAATAIKVVDDLRAASLALTARVSVARGHADEALRVALAASTVADACPDLELTFGLPRLALAEAHAALGDNAAAKEALGHVVSAVKAIAGTIASEEHRKRFEERPLANDRIAQLARSLG